MVEIAGHHVGAAAEHGFERIRTALEVDQFDIEAGLVEFAELLGQHGRQVAQAGAAADRDRDLALRCGKTLTQRQRQQRSGQPAKQFLHGFLHSVAGNIVQRNGIEKATLVPSRPIEIASLIATDDRRALFHRPHNLFGERHRC